MKKEYYRMCIGCIFILMMFCQCDDFSNPNKASGVEAISMSIKKPASGDKIIVNEDYAIQWNKEEGNRVKIELLNNKNVMTRIAEKTANGGTYDWNAVNVIPGVNYQIRITLLDGPYKGRCCESETFTIKEEFTGEVLTPAQGTIYELGDNCEISWNIPYGNYVKIILIQNDETETSIKRTENTGTCSWKTYSEPSEKYRICISPVDGPNASDTCMSEFFGIQDSWELLGDGSPGEGSYFTMSMSDDTIYVIYQDTRDGFNRLKSHMKKWTSGHGWEDCGFVSNGYSFYFSTVFTQSQNPLVIYSELDGNVYSKIYIRKWDGTTWEPAEEILMFDGSSVNSGYPIGISTAIDENNHILCSFLSINIKEANMSEIMNAYLTLPPGEFLKQFVRVYLRAIKKTNSGWEDLGTNTGDSNFINGKFITELDAAIVQPVIKQYITYSLSYEDRINYDTSLVLDNNGNPYIAYIDNTTETNMVKIIRYLENKWEALGDYVSDTESMYVTIAISGDNVFVVYIDLENNKTRVKKYTTNSDEWEQIGVFGGSAGTRPVIIIDSDGNPVVTSSGGIKKYNGTGWDNLGCPNWSEGTKHTSWWIGATSDSIVAAFLNNENKICIKWREKN
jgi:hypothetical protein